VPRIAVGDLLIDLDVPSSWACEYSLAGSLLAVDSARKVTLEVSGLHLQPSGPAATDLGVQHVLDAAQRYGTSAREAAPGVWVVKETAGELPTWMAAQGNRLVVATLHLDPSSPSHAALEAEVDGIVASVGAAHDPFPPPSETPAFSQLRDSQRLFFEQRRSSLRAAFSWELDGPVPTSKLDDFWDALVEKADDELEFLETKLSALGVAFGDHLVRRGFEWRIVSDQWGVAFGVVALPESSAVVVVPDSFVGKRWERRECAFFTDSVEAIMRDVEASR
jgi:hypothetical protein